MDDSSTGAGGKPDHTADRMAACLGMKGLTDRERILLSAIAFHDGPGGAFPGHHRLGEIVGVKRRQLINILESIRRKGRVSWARRHGNQHLPNVYRIAYGDPCQCAFLALHIGTPSQCAISGAPKCNAGLHTNLNPRASRSGNEPSKDREFTDACDPSPERCRFWALVEAGSCCPACGCEKERQEFTRRGPARPGGRANIREKTT